MAALQSIFIRPLLVGSEVLFRREQLQCNGSAPTGLAGRFSLQSGLLQELQILTVLSLTKVRVKEEKMLNEQLLIATLCVAMLGVMALFYVEFKLLRRDH